MEQPVESLMKTTMQNIKNMIDVNTVVGDAVETKDGTVIVPISKVSFAFVAGGGEYNNKTQGQSNEQDSSKLPFAGGSGAGVTVQPLGFLTTSNGQLKMLPVNYNNTIDRVIDLVPQVVENVENFINKRSEHKGGAEGTDIGM